MSLHRETVYINKPFVPRLTREQIEKQYLNNRNNKENKTSYTTYNVVDNILDVDPNNKTLYSDTTIQYNKNITAADVLKQEQIQSRQIKQNKLKQRYEQQIQQDNNRSNNINNNKINELKRIDNIVFKQQKQQLNSNNTLAYNPITLQYNNTDAGRDLLHRDNIKRYNALHRMQQVDQRYNNDFNPINGLPNKRIILPDRPTKHDQI